MRGAPATKIDFALIGDLRQWRAAQLKTILGSMRWPSAVIDDVTNRRQAVQIVGIGRQAKALQLIHKGA